MPPLDPIRSFAAGSVLVAACLAATNASAADGLERLFPKRAEIRPPSSSGLVRVPLPVDVIAEAAPDLSDLRVFDAGGNEVPFVVDSTRRPVALHADRTVERTLRILDMRRETRARPGLGPSYRERVVLEVPEPRANQELELSVDSRRPEFVRELRVGPVDGSEPWSSGSVFRLTNPTRERRSFVLGERHGGKVQVELSGEGGYLEPSFRLGIKERAASERELSLPLVELSRHRENGRTRLRLVRPRGVVPDRVVVVTRTSSFHRPVTVRDVGPGGEERVLGAGDIFRVENVAGGTQLMVPLTSPPLSDRLELEIDDAGSPELAELSVVALVGQPSLVMSASRARWLGFGGGRARRGDYDVQRLEGTDLGRAMLDGAVVEASLGPREPNPEFDPRPALEFALRPGPALDLARFSHRRSLRIEAAPEGLCRVVLGPEELSRLRADLSDLRIVDENAKQWPYFVERASEVLEVPVALRPSRAAADQSRFALELPRAPLGIERVSLDAAAQYVSRDVELLGITEGGERRVLYRGLLSRAPGSTERLEMAFAPERFTGLELTIENGSDAPLALTEVKAKVTAGEVFLAAPPGNYELLVGDTRAEPARYELARARQMAFSVPAGRATLGAFEANPAYVRPSRVRVPFVALWVTVGAAVLALGAITLRLASREAEEPAPADGDS